jgi:hypothetical protein
MRNNCVHQQPVSSILHLSCQLVLCSIWHLQQHSHVVSLFKLSCHYAQYCHEAPKYYSKYLLLFWIHCWENMSISLMARFVSGGKMWTEFSWGIRKANDLPQLVIILTRYVGLILIIFYVVLNREICERCIGKDVEGSSHGLFWYYTSICLEWLRNTVKTVRRFPGPDFNLRPSKYETGLLISLPQHSAKCLCCWSVNTVEIGQMMKNLVQCYMIMMWYEVHIKIQLETMYWITVSVFLPFLSCHNLFVVTISLLYSDKSCVHSVLKTFEVHCSSEPELKTSS